MFVQFPRQTPFRGVSVLDFHSRIAGLAGFSVCTSLISGLTCDLGRQVSSELAFSVSWPVCGVCRLHNLGVPAIPARAAAPVDRADTEMGPTSGTTGERENYKNHVKCDNQRNNYHIDREFHRTIHIIAH